MQPLQQRILQRKGLAQKKLAFTRHKTTQTPGVTTTTAVMDAQVIMQRQLQAPCGKGSVRTLDGRHQQSDSHWGQLQRNGQARPNKQVLQAILCQCLEQKAKTTRATFCPSSKKQATWGPGACNRIAAWHAHSYSQQQQHATDHNIASVVPLPQVDGSSIYPQSARSKTYSHRLPTTTLTVVYTPCPEVNHTRTITAQFCQNHWLTGSSNATLVNCQRRPPKSCHRYLDLRTCMQTVTRSTPSLTPVSKHPRPRKHTQVSNTSCCTALCQQLLANPKESTLANPKEEHTGQLDTAHLMLRPDDSDQYALHQQSAQVVHMHPNTLSVSAHLPQCHNTQQPHDIIRSHTDVIKQVQ